MFPPRRQLLLGSLAFGALGAACGGGSSGGGPGPMFDAMVAEDSPPPAGAACRFESASGTAPALAAVRGDTLDLVLADGTTRTIRRIADGQPWTTITFADVRAAGPRFVLHAEVELELGEARHRELVGFDQEGTQRWELAYDDAGYEALYPGATGWVAIARYGEGLSSLLVDPEGVVTPIGELLPQAAPSATGWVAVTRPLGEDLHELGWRAPDGAFTSLASGYVMDLRWSGDALVGLVQDAPEPPTAPTTRLLIARPGGTTQLLPVADEAWTLGAAADGWALITTFSQDVYRVDVATGSIERVTVVLPEGGSISGSEQLFVPPSPALGASGALEHGLAIDDEVAVYRSADGAAWSRVSEAFTLGPRTTEWVTTPLIGWLERAGTTATFVTSSCEGCPEAGTVLLQGRDGTTATVEGAATEGWQWTGEGPGVLSADGGCLAYLAVSPDGDETLRVRDLATDRTIELGTTPRGERFTWSTRRPLWLRSGAGNE